jgi:hypothetical protein
MPGVDLFFEGRKIHVFQQGFGIHGNRTPEIDDHVLGIIDRLKFPRLWAIEQYRPGTHEGLDVISGVP